MQTTEITFDNKEVDKYLSELLSNVKSVSKKEDILLRALSPLVVADVIRHFEQEVGPDGAWKPWSVSYIAAIQGRVAFRRFGGRTVPLDPYTMEMYGIKPPRKMGQKLQVSGHLRNALKPTNYKAQGEYVYWYNNAKTKSGAPYAYYHNEGIEPNPKREFMYLSDAAKTNILGTIMNFIMKVS